MKLRRMLAKSIGAPRKTGIIVLGTLGASSYIV